MPGFLLLSVSLTPSYTMGIKTSWASLRFSQRACVLSQLTQPNADQAPRPQLECKFLEAGVSPSPSTPGSKQRSTGLVGDTQGIFHCQHGEKMERFYFNDFRNLGQMPPFLSMTKMNT